jgi:hypothetical protein
MLLLLVLPSSACRSTPNKCWDSTQQHWQGQTLCTAQQQEPIPSRRCSSCICRPPQKHSSRRVQQQLACATCLGWQAEHHPSKTAWHVSCPCIQQQLTAARLIPCSSCCSWLRCVSIGRPRAALHAVSFSCIKQGWARWQQCGNDV